MNILNFQKKTAWLLPALFIITVLSFSACDDDENSANPGLITLQTNSSLGPILVDGEGMTLYIFTKDVAGQSQCLEGCLTNWPVYYAPSLQPGEGIDAADFSTLTRTDGTMQTTYKGWPLYYFSGDAAPGDVEGEAVNNVWFVAKPDYSLMLATAQLIGLDEKNYTGDYTEGSGETEFLVDANGRTLYRFTKDFKDMNKFTKSDLSNNGAWPVFFTEIGALPGTLNKDDFGSIDVFGNQQLTYKGHPLYYFGQDANRGETKGVSVPSPGVWPIVNTQTTPAVEQPTVKITTHATLGDILTDKDGRTLYFFARDTKGTSNCTGNCLNRWPLFNSETIIVQEGSGLLATDFATTGDGDSKQVTYKGRPLYYYSPAADGIVETAGEAGGQNYASVWFVAKTDYSLMIAMAQLTGLDGKNYTNAYIEGTGLTRYFTDGAGRTLYVFTNDRKDTNTFTAAGLSNNGIWPIFNTTVSTLPPGLNADDFGTITVHGETQLTYRGWPVYYFGSDTSQGDTKGVSVPTPGKWPVFNEDTAEAPL